MDVVISRYFAHHWQDVGQALREVKRVLIPGGEAIFIDVVPPDIRFLMCICRRWKSCGTPRTFATIHWAND